MQHFFLSPSLRWEMKRWWSLCLHIALLLQPAGVLSSGSAQMPPLQRERVAVRVVESRHGFLGVQWSLFFPFLWLVYFSTDRLAHRAVVMMSAGIDLRGWQQDVHADSRDQEEVVEHGISFIFGKGPRLLKKSGSFSVNFRCFLECHLDSYLCDRAEDCEQNTEPLADLCCLSPWPSPKHKKMPSESWSQWFEQDVLITVSQSKPQMQFMPARWWE